MDPVRAFETICDQVQKLCPTKESPLTQLFHHTVEEHERVLPNPHEWRKIEGDDQVRLLEYTSRLTPLITNLLKQEEFPQEHIHDLLSITQKTLEALDACSQKRTLTSHEIALQQSAQEVFRRLKRQDIQDQISELEEKYKVFLEDLDETASLEEIRTREAEIGPALKEKALEELEKLKNKLDAARTSSPQIATKFSSQAKWVEETEKTTSEHNSKEIIIKAKDLTDELNKLKQANKKITDHEDGILAINQWKQNLIEKLGEVSSEKLRTGFDTDIEELLSLAKQQYASIDEAEIAFLSLLAKTTTLQAEIQKEAVSCAKELPHPILKISTPPHTLFRDKTERVAEFIRDNWDEVVSELFVTDTVSKRSLVENGKKICVLKAFYDESGQVNVYILKPLGKGEYKSAKLGPCLYGSSPETPAVLACARKKKHGALESLGNEMAVVAAFPPEAYPEYVIRMRSVVDMKNGIQIGLLEEFCDGGTLEDSLTSPTYKAGDLHERLTHSWQLAKALESIHDARIVHLDLKPANVFLKIVAGKKAVRLSDFGLSLHTSDQIRGFRGTPLYTAPEMFSENRITAAPSLDMWGLGVNLLEMFCDERVNVIKSMMHTHIPPFTSLSPQEKIQLLTAARDQTVIALSTHPIPEKLKLLITQLLSIDPQQRPSAQQTEEILAELLASKSNTK